MTTPLLTYRGDAGVKVDLDRFIASRGLIQANSGGGKSRALRYLLEQTFGRVQHLVIDPEGEFPTLREKFDYVLAANSGGDVLASPKTAKLLCRRLVELGASAVLDLYELKLPERREFVKVFLTELMSLPRDLWRPILVVVDEAHMFCPEHGESQSSDAVIQLCTQGRKRGFCAVLATQRISKLHKDAAAELLNKMIGRTGLDIDVKRAGDELGFDKDQRQALKTLKPGEFFVYGPAVSDTVVVARSGDVATTHPEPGSLATTVAATPAKVKAMLAQLVDLPKEAEEEARSIAELQKVVKQLKGDLSRAQRGVAVIDPADIQRKVAAAVDKARADWSRNQRTVTDRNRKGMKSVRDQLHDYQTRLSGIASRLAQDIEQLDSAIGAADREVAIPTVPERPPVAASRPRNTPVTQRSDRPAIDFQIVDGSLSAPQQRMLDALASFEAIGVHQLARSHVAVFSNQSSRSSGFRANLSALSAKGLIDRVNSTTVKLTDDGRIAASGESAPATLDELHDAWMAKLSSPQRLMLKLLLEEQDGFERDELAKSSGQSPLSSGFRANLSALSALGLTAKLNGKIIASDLLYPDGL